MIFDGKKLSLNFEIRFCVFLFPAPQSGTIIFMMRGILSAELHCIDRRDPGRAVGSVVILRQEVLEWCKAAPAERVNSSCVCPLVWKLKGLRAALVIVQSL